MEQTTQTKEQPTDEELMLLYQAGDEQAFTALYQRYASKVYGYLQSHLKSRSMVDDVFQSVFMKLHRSRSRYDNSFPFTPWLFTICKSTLIDAIRSKQRVREDADSEILDQAIAPDASSPPTEMPEIEALSLSELPVQQRQALEMRYQKELTFEQIAKHLDTSPANARQLVSRAIRKLKLAFDGGRSSK